MQSPTGKTASYGSLAVAAAAATTKLLSPSLKPPTQFTVIGKATKRVDALAAVTGKKTFAMDLQIRDALPTMVARPPTINGTPKSVANAAAVAAMPGITDVALISTGVAVRGKTFGQCIDAIRALQVTWNAGTEDGKSDATVLAELKAAEIPLAVPEVPLLAKTVEGSFTFYFRSNSPLETGAAIASYTATSIEVWSQPQGPDRAADGPRAEVRHAGDQGEGARRDRAAGRSAGTCSATRPTRRSRRRRRSASRSS